MKLHCLMQYTDTDGDEVSRSENVLTVQGESLY